MVKFFFYFNSKINKQLSLKTVSIINLFITYLFIIKMPYLSDTERIEVLMMIGYGDRRRSCAEVMTLLMTQKMKRSLCDTVKTTLYHEINPCCHLKKIKLALYLENK
jgi:hypothetical protein